MDLIVLLMLAALTLLAISVLRTYRMLPVRELKRRARRGDKQAAQMFKAASYGSSLHVLLWLLVGVAAGLFFWFVSTSIPDVVAFFLIVVLLLYGFAWMPSRESGGVGKSVAAATAPVLAWVLQYLHSVIDLFVGFTQKHWPITVHTGLYDQDDLLELLHFQKNQPDNTIPDIELEIATHALNFGSRQVRDCLIPRRVVKMVKADETVGPILMSELHASGFSRFPVYEGKKNKIVGTLFLRDMVKGKTGSVSKVMRPEVVYVHEEQPLTDALQAILKTHHHLLIVVNSFEEFVGVITIEDVLEQIVGSPIIDEFDQYEDLRAVAKRAAAVEHKENNEPQKENVPEPEPSPEPAEVVE